MSLVWRTLFKFYWIDSFFSLALILWLFFHHSLVLHLIMIYFGNGNLMDFFTLAMCHHLLSLVLNHFYTCVMIFFFLSQAVFCNNFDRAYAVLSEVCLQRSCL
jgi:hypothetical protein